MKHLWEMTLDELLNPQGHACSCGRVQRCGLKMLRVGKGAVDALPEALLLHAAFDGRPLAKPLAFVLENGQYRFDGGNVHGLSGDTYTIRNLTYGEHTLHCIDNNVITVRPREERGMWCQNEEAVCDGDGTRFTFAGRGHYCDWNSWGVDFYINGDGSGQCNDRC